MRTEPGFSFSEQQGINTQQNQQFVCCVSKRDMNEAEMLLDNPHLSPQLLCLVTEQQVDGIVTKEPI